MTSANTSTAGPMTGHDRSLIVKHHGEGLTPHQIAFEIDRGYSTVARHLRKCGLKPNSLKKRNPRPSVVREVVTHESYAIHSGGMTVVSHGMGEDHAERSLSAMIAPYDLVERGTRKIGARTSIAADTRP